MAARRRKMCAVVSPLGSERIPHEEECAAVERFHDGALCPEPVRRPKLEVIFPRAGGAVARSSPRATAVGTDPGKSHPPFPVRVRVRPSRFETVRVRVRFSRFEIGCSFLSFYPNQIYTLEKTLAPIPLLKLLDRLG
jgi:hypothetical protein